MRVCLDISAAMTPQPSGIGRYAHQLACALSALPNTLELSLFHNRRQQTDPPAGLETFPRSEAPLGDKPWRALLLAGMTPPRRWSQTIHTCDLFHGTDSITPKLSQPTVITIHDLTTQLFPKHHSPLNRWYQRFALPIMVKRADAIITDAEVTRQDIITRYTTPSEKIISIPIGVDHRRFCAQNRQQAQEKVRQKLNIPSPYILAVGTLEPRKNLLRLIEAYAQLENETPPLVIAGAKGWGNHPIGRRIDELGLHQRIVLPGFVPDELLPTLYAGADLFVYPSIYEGFGLPVLEALACGVPVITSNVSSLPEVAGDAAILVDPLRVEEIRNAMHRVLNDGALAQTLSEKGKQRASWFTWERTAQAMVEVYKELLAMHG